MLQVSWAGRHKLGPTREKETRSQRLGRFGSSDSVSPGSDWPGASAAPEHRTPATFAPRPALCLLQLLFSGPSL